MKERRRPLVCGNWKMNCTRADARALVDGIGRGLGSSRPADVAVAPPFTAIEAVAAACRDHGILLGAQDVHFEKSGAFTGAVSAGMLADAGCVFGIVGHSERRALFHETDDQVVRKTRALLSVGLRPLVCVGETLAERDADRTLERVLGQVDAALAGVEAAAFPSITLAYEPVWAIGTGRNATSAQAQEVHAAIRGRLRERFGPLADETRILYGGSMKPDNAAELLSMPDVDGGLVGGASLQVEPFLAIVRASE